MQITLEGHLEPAPLHSVDTALSSSLRAGIAFSFSRQAGNYAFSR